MLYLTYPFTLLYTLNQVNFSVVLNINLAVFVVEYKAKNIMRYFGFLSVTPRLNSMKALTGRLFATVSWNIYRSDISICSNPVNRNICRTELFISRWFHGVMPSKLFLPLA
jgi:hypothetical protein